MGVKNVVILGATGSVGQSALAVAREHPERVRVVGLAAGSNARALEEAAREFPGARTVLASAPGGAERLAELAALPEADMVLVAIVGTGGLRPALAAIEAGKDLALASKEILVMAGELVMGLARRRGVRVLPVDSEHNAIHQCLDGRPPGAVRRLILTCSGGPFRKAGLPEIQEATPAQALRHPTWQMGRKITVDSATLFNKGLEMIEARWLFDVPVGKVDVVVHPQSIVHSLVEFTDGSMLAQLSHSDMRFPIQYAFTWPERAANSLPPLDLARVGRLDFEAPREDVFPALRLAREACERCGTHPAVLNAANEVAVAAFLEGRIRLPEIWETVEAALAAAPHTPSPSLEQILAADAWARSFGAGRCGG
ncbi:MAG: 1-deoxy-D-xylulose-5-phosphate reductoisomerase [Terrimicrobiaceae bacterium]|nr:1-deoxy-D-xylulose-5-phosphate reductoisomerase [Terrimicrobiaceae bacterium]